MDVRPIKDQKTWDEFLTQRTGMSARSVLLQSWEWTDFQHQFEGLPVERLGVYVNDSLQAVVALSVRTLPFGKTVLFSASAPVLANECTDEPAVYAAIVESDAVQQLAKQHAAICWRFSPITSFDAATLPGVHTVPDIEPSLTLMLDLSNSEEELLAQMKPKTRYNIRLAERKEVKVEYVSGEIGSASLADAYWTLLSETNERHRISAYPKQYYTKMFETLGAAGMLELAIARHEKDIVAMNIILRFGETTTYLHGASTHTKKNVMAPYLLQWESIRRAKAAGAQWYDFYGIAPESEPQHKLAGVSRFKRGFGGEEVCYAGMFEYPLSKLWYTAYQLYKRVRS